MEFKVTRTNELYHHGIQGQKWGIRNGPPYPLDRSNDDPLNEIVSVGKSYLRDFFKNKVVDFYRWPEMDDFEYAKACELFNKKEEVKLPSRLYAMVSNMMHSDLSDIEKASPTFTREIGGYKLWIANKGYDEYKVYDIRKVPSDKTWLDQIMDAVVGEGWEKYDY